MEKSIENIWKSGFENKNNLVPPKIVDLYNKKSINAVDKLMALGKANIYFIIGGGIILMSIAATHGATIYGIIIFLLLMVSVKYGENQSRKVEQIDKSQSSYSYLLEVKQWLNETIIGYTKVYRFIYPALILIFFMGFLKSDAFSDVLVEINQKSPDLLTFLDIPLIWFTPIVVLCILSILFTARIFKADLNIVYKGVFEKLDTLIEDMEEISQNNR